MGRCKKYRKSELDYELPYSRIPGPAEGVRAGIDYGKRAEDIASFAEVLARCMFNVFAACAEWRKASELALAEIARAHGIGVERSAGRDVRNGPLSHRDILSQTRTSAAVQRNRPRMQSVISEPVLGGK